MRRKNVLKAYFCIFHLRIRGPWYATKHLLASFLTAIFKKFAGAPGPPMTKSINMVWGAHIARVKTKNILNLRISLFKASLSYVEKLVLRTGYLRGTLFVRPPPRLGGSGGASFGTDFLSI